MGTKELRFIIFDLSEVLTFGLLRFEENIARELGLDGEMTDEAFGGPHLQALLRGDITEDHYLRKVLKKNSWTIEPARLKMLLRQNFHVTIPETIEIATVLARSYTLVLLSDHAKEWISSITRMHSFLDNLFTYKVFSCDIGSTKQDAQTFRRLLQILSAEPYHCIFIDDSIRNIEVARSVGIDGIRFLNAQQLRRELRERGIASEGEY
jgi:putative hydrolase of the HAD superfamily